MWTREELKGRAKAVLKVSYWKAFVVSLLLLFFCTGSGASSAGNARDTLNGNYNASVTDFGSFTSGFQHRFNSFVPGPDIANWVVASITVTAIIALFAGIAFAVFVSGPLEVGCRRYFTSACCYQFNLSDIGMAFKGGRYLNVVWVMLCRAIFTFLWSLLLVIPGIIKGLAYSMVPYILADNPHMDAMRAIQLSQDMTRGHKWDMFVLNLSFLGWYILGSIPCGVGVWFVAPYYDSTKAELYMVLRHNAIGNGLVTLEELCLE